MFQGPCAALGPLILSGFYPLKAPLEITSKCMWILVDTVTTSGLSLYVTPQCDIQPNVFRFFYTELPPGPRVVLQPHIDHHWLKYSHAGSSGFLQHPLAWLRFFFWTKLKGEMGGAWIKRHLPPPAAPEGQRAEIWSPSPRCCCLSRLLASRTAVVLERRAASSPKHTRTHTHTQWNTCDDSAFKIKAFLRDNVIFDVSIMSHLNSLLVLSVLNWLFTFIHTIIMFLI